jgi:Tol biopolymer transport system component
VDIDERPGGYGEVDIWRADWRYGAFVRTRVNTAHHESNSVIAPDESYILFVSSIPEDGNLLQISVSFQIGDNQ